ncbi:MAG TPA: cytochrome b/b6 domain-containing protein [Vicinamibacterales bacterium]|nr:cytochrome b/b6 domain-containing protein [Vicinamibacterales bacterium]
MRSRAEQEDQEYVQRFSAWARTQHVFAIVFFGLLVLTGMPQKWPYLEASRWLIDAMGGLYAVRWLHRVAGVGFTILLVAHLAVAITGIARRKSRPTMLLSRKDFHDAINNLKYYMGWADSPPRFGRFDYRQKFEYWGLIFGGSIMVLSGFILLYPIIVSQILPAELIPVAKVTHSYEALLALLIIVIWHIAGASLTPESFPMDTSIFTGKITKEKLRREHALEYERLFGKP